MRGLGSIPTRGNILFLEFFCFHTVKTKMRILAFLCVCEKPERCYLWIQWLLKCPKWLPISKANNCALWFFQPTNTDTIASVCAKIILEFGVEDQTINTDEIWWWWVSVPWDLMDPCMRTEGSARSRSHRSVDCLNKGSATYRQLKELRKGSVPHFVSVEIHMQTFCIKN